jgi:hypothetical protein
MSIIGERLKTLGIMLPEVMPPVAVGYVAAFAPYLSGRLGKRNGKILCSSQSPVGTIPAFSTIRTMQRWGARVR